MEFFKKKEDKLKKFSFEELKRRDEDIPPFKSVTRKSPFHRFDDDSLLFQEVTNKPIPASIEYSLDKKKEKKSRDKAFDSEGAVEGDISPETVAKYDGKDEFPDLDKLLFEPIPSHHFGTEKDDERPRTLEELSQKYIDDQVDNFSKASLADEAEINELEKKHMNFYSILSRIQETHVASEFKSAYDIQDRISYLLNHKTLLYKSLVSELLIYLDSIVEKMEKYHAEISEKQKKFNRYNRKVSELQKYKFKTDESIKIMDRSQEVAHRELEQQKKNAEETP